MTTPPLNYHRPIPESLTPQCLLLGTALVENAVQDIEQFLCRRRQRSAARNTHKPGGPGNTYNTLQNLTVQAVQAVLWFRGDDPKAVRSIHGLTGSVIPFRLICDALNTDAEHLWSALNARLDADRERRTQWRRLLRITDNYLRYEQRLGQAGGLLSGQLHPAQELLWEMVGESHPSDSSNLNHWVYIGRYGRRLPCRKIDGKLYTTRAALAWFFAKFPFRPRRDHEQPQSHHHSLPHHPQRRLTVQEVQG